MAFPAFRKTRVLDDGWPEVGRAGILAFGVGTLLFWLVILFDADGYIWFIDNVNLVIHEAGHMVFLPLGQTMHMWGGTLLQCILPFAFVVSFWRRRQPAGAAVSGLWLGESLLNVSIYASDAKSMALPLLFGGIHDWNYMLGQLGLVNSCRSIGAAIWFSGWIIMIASAGWYVWRWRLSSRP